MYLHRFGDLVISSGSRVDGVPVASGASADWTFVASRGKPPEVRRQYHQTVWPGTTQPWRTLARTPDGHVARYHRTASFLIDVKHHRIVAYPRAHVSRVVLHQLLISQIVPLLFSLGDQLVLHGSAVATSAGAVGFVGASRQGKSTIAGALGLRGFPLIADDCLVIDRRPHSWTVRLFDVGVRLWPDSATRFRRKGAPGFCADQQGKQRFNAGDLGFHYASGATKMRALYLMSPKAPTAPLRSTPVPAREAHLALLNQMYQLGHDDPAALRAGFLRLSDLVAGVEVRRLSYPRTLSALDRIVDRVLDDMAR